MCDLQPIRPSDHVAWEEFPSLLAALDRRQRQVEVRLARLVDLLTAPPQAKPLPALELSPAPWIELLQELFGARLTPREREVCAYRVLRYGPSEIAAALYISEHTVHAHTNRVRHEFGLEHARQIRPFVLARLAERLGSLCPRRDQ